MSASSGNHNQVEFVLFQILSCPELLLRVDHPEILLILLVLTRPVSLVPIVERTHRLHVVDHTSFDLHETLDDRKNPQSHQVQLKVQKEVLNGTRDFKILKIN